jgi:MFS family permease
MATTSGQRPSWLLKGVIILAATVQMITYAAPTPLLSRMATEFHGPMDGYMLKMILGVAGPAMMAGAALGGVLTDMGGRRPTMVGSAVLFGLAGAAPFLLHSLPAILATRFVTAAAAAAIATIGQAMIGDHFPEAKRPGWMGLFVAVGMISGFLCFPVSGVLGEIGWRWPFLIYLIGLAIALFAVAGMPSHAPASKTPHAAGAAAEAPKPAPTKAAARAANYPVKLFFLAFTTGPIFTLPSIYLSFYTHRFGYDGPSATSALLTVSAVLSACTALTYGGVRRRLSIRFIFGLGFGLGTLGLLVLALAPNIWVCGVAMVMTGLAIGWVHPNVFAAVIDSVDEHHRGRAVGITQAAGSLAPAVGVTALEPLVSQLGIGGIYLLLAACAALVTLSVVIAGAGRGRVAPAAAG